MKEGELLTERGFPCWNPPCRRVVLSLALNGVDFVAGRVTATDEAEVEALIEQREAARKDRDYFTADGIRDMLQVAHVLLPSAGSLPSLSSCLPPFSPVRPGPCAIDTLWRGLRCMSPKT